MGPGSTGKKEPAIPRRVSRNPVMMRKMSMYWLLVVGFWLFCLSGLNPKIKNNPVYYLYSSDHYHSPLIK
jgi:hypothetical protein